MHAGIGGNAESAKLSFERFQSAMERACLVEKLEASEFSQARLLCSITKLATGTTEGGVQESFAALTGELGSFPV
jgi:hypothetical protein